MVERLKRVILYLKKIIIENKFHFFAWLIFIFWETIMVGIFTGNYGTFWNYAVHYTINIFLFYYHVHVLENSTVNKIEAYWKIPIYVSLEIVAYTFGVLLMDELLRMYTEVLPSKASPLLPTIFRLTYRCSFFLLFSTGYFFFKRFIEERNERNRIERERFIALLDKERTTKELALSRNAFLRAQVNPHLLYNTFDFIHQRLANYSPKDADIILYLSDIMRYASSTGQDDGEVILEDEIEQCENLIKLQRATRGELFIELASSYEIRKLRLIPLLLLTILENIFKHGRLHERDERACIDIYSSAGYLYIQSSNWPAVKRSKIGFNSGIQNIRSRLDFAYGSEAKMNAGLDPDGLYRISIVVELKALGVNYSKNGDGNSLTKSKP